MVIVLVHQCTSFSLFIKLSLFLLYMLPLIGGIKMYIYTDRLIKDGKISYLSFCTKLV